MPTNVRFGMAVLAIITVACFVVFLHEYNGNRMTDLDWMLLKAAGGGVVLFVIALWYYRVAPEDSAGGDSGFQPPDEPFED